MIAFFLLFGYLSCPSKSGLHALQTKTQAKHEIIHSGSLCLIYCRTELSFLVLLIFLPSSPLKSTLPCRFQGYLSFFQRLFTAFFRVF